MHLLQTGADKYFGGRPRNASEYILHLNEVVSIVGILEKDPNTNQYILLPTAKQIGKKKIKVGGITTLHKYSPGSTSLSLLSSFIFASKMTEGSLFHDTMAKNKEVSSLARAKNTIHQRGKIKRRSCGLRLASP